MSSVNKAILVGHVGQDPEMRYMPNGDAVANLSLATSEKWTDKASGEKRETTEWHRVVCFRKLGEVVGEYVKKGALLYIEGRIQTRKWTDKEGVERYSTEIVADVMQMLGPKQERDTTPARGRDTARPRNRDTASAPPSPSFDDDVPF